MFIYEKREVVPGAESIPANKILKNQLKIMIRYFATPKITLTIWRNWWLNSQIKSLSTEFADKNTRQMPCDSRLLGTSLILQLA